MEDKRKHLELIQGIINRMASNSFLLKGWTLTLVSALFALTIHDISKVDVLITCVPAIMFWILDGYFLRQERLYRKLYDGVRKKDDAAIDYSMDTRPYTSEVASWILVMFSRTLLIYYGAVLTTVIIVRIVSAHLA